MPTRWNAAGLAGAPANAVEPKELMMPMVVPVWLPNVCNATGRVLRVEPAMDVFVLSLFCFRFMAAAARYLGMTRSARRLEGRQIARIIARPAALDPPHAQEAALGHSANASWHLFPP